MVVQVCVGIGSGLHFWTHWTIIDEWKPGWAGILGLGLGLGTRARAARGLTFRARARARARVR